LKYLSAGLGTMALFKEKEQPGMSGQRLACLKVYGF
jgi:hypothetical protein